MNVMGTFVCLLCIYVCGIPWSTSNCTNPDPVTTGSIIGSTTGEAASSDAVVDTKG